jgi:hypothetical protein
MTVSMAELLSPKKFRLTLSVIQPRRIMRDQFSPIIMLCYMLYIKSDWHDFLMLIVIKSCK